MEKEFYVLTVTNTAHGFSPENATAYSTIEEARAKMIEAVSEFVGEDVSLDDEGCCETSMYWIDYYSAGTLYDNKCYWDIFRCVVEVPAAPQQPKQCDENHFYRCLQNAMELGKYLDQMVEKTGLSRDKCAMQIQEWAVEAEEIWLKHEERYHEYDEFIKSFGEDKYHEFIHRPKHKVVRIQVDVVVDGYLDDSNAIETAINDILYYTDEYIGTDNVVEIKDMK